MAYLWDISRQNRILEFSHRTWLTCMVYGNFSLVGAVGLVEIHDSLIAGSPALLTD